jgi:VCBS repeat-containing protein
MMFDGAAVVTADAAAHAPAVAAAAAASNAAADAHAADAHPADAPHAAATTASNTAPAAADHTADPNAPHSSDAPADANHTAPANTTGEHHNPADALHDALTATAPVDASHARQEIFFVDSSLPDLNTLVASLPAHADIVYLNANSDGLTQIAAALQGRENVDAIHIITHATEGAVIVGDSILTTSSIEGQYHDILAEIGSHMSSTGDVLIYGCDFAAGSDGATAVEALAHALNTDVAASTDTTGVDGNWILEDQVGIIETTAIQATDWHHDLLLAANDTFTAYVGTGNVLNVLANDGLSGILPVVTIASGPAHGTVVVNADGTITYTPTVGYAGATDTFSYTAKLAGLLGTTATVTLNLDRPPVVTAPTTVSGSEDSNLTLSGANRISVSDADNTTTTVTLSVPAGTLGLQSSTGLTFIQGAASGSSTVTISGTIANVNAALNGLIYTPVGDAYSTAAAPINLTVTAVDAALGTSTSTVALVLAPVTDTVTDTVVTKQSTPASFNVLANDNFSNAGRIVTGFSAPAHGVVTIDAQGNAIYTPTAGYSGADSFTYTVTSGGSVETGTVNVTTLLNYAPTITAPSATQVFNEDATRVFSSANGNAITVADANNDVLTVTVASTHGTLTLGQTTGLTFISGDGVADASMVVRGTAAAINAALNGLQFIPVPDYNGSALVSVQASDGIVAVQSASVALSLTAVTDGVADSVSTGPLAPVTFSPLTNDTFAAGAVVTSISSPGHGLAVLLNNTITYTPGLGYTGNDSFTYTVTSGGVTETVAVNVVVGDTAPVGPATLGTIATVDAGLVALTPGLLFRDPDLLDVLTFTATGLPAGLTISPLLGAITGIVDSHASVNGINGTGTYNIVVTATDLSGLSVSSTLVMTVTNPAPIPLVGLSIGGSENALLGIGLNALVIVDPDGDAFSITNATAQHGTVTIKADGSLSYQPNANYYGADTITYTVKDVDGGTATGYVAVLLAQVPTLPILNLPSLSLPLLTEDTPLLFANLLGQKLTVGDVDGDLLTVDLDVPLGLLGINNLTEHGAVTISQHTGANGGNVLTLQGSAVDINAALADLVYTPAADYNGALTINIGLGKLLGGIINVTASLPITIAPVADIVDDNVNATLNTPASFNVLANDTFENAGRTVTGHTNPTHGTVTIDAQGNATYTPTTGYLGVDSFTYTVTSNGTTETATVHINTALPNYAPTVASPSTATVNEDTTQVFSSANANAIVVADANNDTLTVTLSATHGTLTLQQTTGLTFTSGDGNADASMVLRGSAADINAALNGLKFTPDADYNGAAAITVSASDGLLSQTNNIAVGINGVRDAITDTVQTTPLAPVTFFPLANDTFTGTPTITGITQGAHGLVVLGLNGAVTYTPALGYTGPDSFTYTVTTASGIVETGTVNVTVGNHAPVSNGNLGTLPVLDAQLVVAVPTAQAFSDADVLDVLHYSATGLPAGLTINSLTGLISGTVDGHASVNGANGSGTYNVVITATDSAGATATSALVVQVTNPAPIPLIGLQVTGSEDLPIDISAAALAIVDLDGDALTITGATALHGTVTINNDGSLRYTPNANYNGLDTITYQVKDADGGTATGYVAVVVAPVIDLPTIQLPSVTLLAEDTPLLFANIIGQHLSVGNVDGDLIDIKLNVPLGLLRLTDTTGISISEGSSTGSTVLHFSGTTAAVNAALNSLIYTPAADYNGPLNITISLNHLTGGIADVNVLLPINIAAVADIVDDHVTTVTNAAVSFNVLANDTFENAGRVVFSHTDPAHGTVTIDAQGNAVYTPGTGFTGTDTFTYTVQSNGTFETATVTIAINTAPDAAPVATPIGNRAGVDGQGVSIDVHSYFSDPDGDTLTYSATGLPANVTINPTTGLISGTLGTHASTTVASGAYAIVVTASDGRGGLVSQSFTLNVANPAPTPVDDAFSADKNTAITGNVLTNDTDPDGDVLHIDTTPVQIPANGTLVLNADGSFVYTPNTNFHGTDTFQYRVIDADGGAATATVTLTVNQTNLAPVIAGTIAAQTGTDAGSFSLDVSGKFTDADGDALAYSVSGLPTGLTISAGGLITGTLGGHASTGGPNNDGVYTVTVTASDGNGGTVSENFTLNVLNPAPVITTATPNPSTNEDTVLVGQVSATDTDGDALTYSATSQPTHGTLVFNANGTYSYTPAANFNGTDSFTYKVADGDGGVATATVTITVNPVNDAPVQVGTIGAQSGVDAAPFTLNVANRFSDVDGDTLTYSSTTLPTGLSIDANGNITGTLGSSASHGGPNGNGVYTITITANDGHGGNVDQSFILTVVNPIPVTSNSAVTIAEDTPFNGTVTATDDDAVTFSVTSGPAHGTLVFNANGTYTYTPAANFNGTDSFTYTVKDADNATAQATVTLTVTPVNDAPVSTSPIGTQAGTDNAVFNLSVANHFSDVDGDSLTYSASGLPAGLSIDASGNITGTLGTSASTQGANGTGQYSIVVSVVDGHGGQVNQTFLLNVSNLAPVASNSTLTLNEDNVATGNLLTGGLASDPDGDALRVDTTAVTAPQHGSLTLNADGTYIYTPNSNYNGSDSFTYRVIDADGAAVTATVSITITPVNDAPVAQGTISAQNANDGSQFSLNVGGNFSDVDNPTLTYSVTGLPTGLSIDANGLITGTLGTSASQGGTNGVYTVTVTASDASLSASQTFTLTVVNLAPVVNNSTLTLAEDSTASGNLLTSNAQDPDGDVLHIDVTPVTAPAHGTLTLGADGTFLYTPAANFYGTDSFSYRVIDADGLATVATVTLNVTPVYDAPQANGSIPAVTANDHTSVSIGVAGNFVDVDGTALTYSAVGLPAGLAIDPTSGLISGTLNSSASAQGPGGHGVYTVQVSANDGFGGTATQTFTLTAVNTVPVAGNGTVTLAEDSVATGTLLNNASDADADALSFVATSQPAHGTLVLNANGTYTYTPAANFNGTDSFNYRVSDPDGGSTTATLTFTVTPVYDAPVAGTPIAAQAGNDGSSVSFIVAGNFSDADGTPLAYSAVGLPAGLSINASTGEIFGTLGSSASKGGPNADGVYSVQVSVSDGLGGTAIQTFTFAAINTLPVANNATVNLAEDTPTVFDLRTNASDADGDALTIVPLTQPAHGTLALNGDGTYTYTPASNFNGTDSFNYRVTDADGATTTATITFTVTPVYDAPAVATPVANQSANDGSAFSLNVAGNFNNPDNAALVYSAANLPNGLSINASTGLITGTLDSSASHQIAGGNYAVVVSVFDGTTLVSQTFTLTAVNTLPVAGNASVNLAEDTSATLDLRATASDADGDVLTIVPATQPAHGSLTLNAHGTYTYTPNANFNGTDSFTYTVTDADGASTTATVTLNVTPVYDAPVAGAPIANLSANDGSAISVNVAGNFSDADGRALTYSATGLPTGVTLDANTGLLSGTLNSSASHQGANNGGAYTIVVTASDGLGGSATQTFVLTAVNTLPVAGNTSVALAEDSNATVDLRALASDTDGDVLTLVPISQPAHGSLTLNADGVTYTYTPNANFNGTDSFNYRVTDADGATTTATVTFTVTPVYDAPQANGTLPTLTANDSSAINLNVAGAFLDADARALTYSATGLPAGVTLDPTTGLLSGTLNSSASHQGANGGGNYSIVITANDGLGGIATQAFTLTAINTLPTAAGASLTLAEDTIATGDLRTLASDADGDVLTFTSAQDPAHGALVLNANGTYTYTPNANFNGTDSFSYRVTDADGATTIATLALTITPVYDAPTPVGTIAAQTVNDGATFNLAVASGFADADGATLTYSATGLPAGVTIDPTSGLISGTLGNSASTQGLNGSAVYNIQVSATDGTTSVSQNFALTAVNPIPTTTTANINLTAGQNIAGNFNNYASDADHDSLSFSLEQGPAHGALSFNATTGTFTYTPGATYNGADSITYRVTDSDGGTTTGVINFNVLADTGGPVASGTIATQVANDHTTLSFSVVGNFTAGTNGGALSYSANGLPPGLSIDASGLISGTLNSSASAQAPGGGGSYTVVVTADDGLGGTATQTFILTAVNTVPQASNATLNLNEDGVASGNLNNFATDADGDVLTFSTVQAPTHGTLTLNPVTGEYTYTPNANFNGTDSFIYQVTDADGGFGRSTVITIVAPQYDGPLPNGSVPSISANDHSTVTLDLSTSFSDADNTPLTYTATGLPTGLTIDLHSGVISGQLGTSASTEGVNGTATYNVVITASDGTTSAVQAFTLTAVNTQPVAANNTLTLAEDSSAQVDLRNTSSDTDGDALTILPTTQPAHGSLTLNPDGVTYTYTPNANYNGPDSFSYRVTDADGAVSNGTISFIVTPVYDAPATVGTINNLSANDHTSVSLNVAGNFSDADGRALTYSATGLPTGVTIDPNTGLISGQLGTSASTQGVGGSGTYNVVISASDGTTSVTQGFTLTAINTLPVANNGTITLPEDGSAQVNLLTTSSDADGDALTVTLTSQPAHGSLTLNPDGVTYTYTPNANFNGTDSFTYRVSDPDTGISNTATITFNVAAVYDAPAPNGTIATQTANDGSGLSLSVAGNFSNVDNAPLTYSATGLPTGVSIDPATGLISGTLGSSASHQGVNGSGDYNIVVRATDGTTAVTQSFTLTAVNTVPTASNATVTLPEDSVAAGNLNTLATDTDGDTLTFSAASQPQHGVLLLNADGSYSYQPVANFNGTDSFNYTVTDADGSSRTATLTFTVTPVYDAPVATTPINNFSANDSTSVNVNVASHFSSADNLPFTYSASNLPNGLSIDPNTGLITGTLNSSASSQAPGGSYTVTVTANDGTTNVSQTFTLTAVNTVPTTSNASVTLAEDGTATGDLKLAGQGQAADADGDTLTFTTVTAPAHGQLTLNANGTYSYSPAANFNGTDSFTYRVSDPDGGSTTATLTFTVTPVYDGPSLGATPIPTLTANDHASISTSVAGNFNNPDNAALTYSATGLPTGLSIDPSTGLITGTLSSSASHQGPGGSGTYGVTVNVTDGTTTVSQTFDLIAVNTVPTASNATLTLPVGSNVSANLLNYAQDADGDVLSFTANTLPTHGALSLNVNGSFTYTPNPGYAGPDVLTYTVTDADGGTTTATLTFNVSAGYQPPATVGNVAPINANDHTSISLNVAGNFTDASGNTLTYTATGLPAGLNLDPTTGLLTGTLNSSASTQGVNGSGTYNVVITASDGIGGSAAQTFTLTAVNTLPVAGNANLNTNEDTPASGDLRNNATDADGDALTFATATPPAHGVLVLNANGTYTYTPAANFNGSDSFTYTVTDADGAASTATIAITVAPVYDAPTTTPISTVSANDSTGVSVGVAGNFSSPDNLPLSYTASGLPAGLTLDPTTGIISGTLGSSASSQAPGGGGNYSVTVFANDGTTTVSQTFTLTAVNTLPTTSNASVTLQQGTTLNASVATFATDADGDTLSFSTAVPPAHGVLTINANGSYTYTPVSGYIGQDSFTYRVTDADGGISTGVVTLNVSALPDNAPVVSTPLPTQTATDGGPFNLNVSSSFSDPDGDTLTYSATGLPPGLTLNPATGLISGTLPNNASGQAPGAGGVYTVTLTASDGSTSVSQVISLVVNNPLPVTTGGAYSLPEDSSVSGVLTATDPDGDAISFAIGQGPSHGSLTLNANGTFTYTPNANYSGADQFTYQVRDSDGGVTTAVVTFTITPVNDAPVSTPGNTTVGSGGPTIIDVVGNVRDPDGDPLTVTSGAAGHGSVVINPNGTVTYTPTAGYTGADVLIYTVSDGRGGTTSGSIAINVTATPVATTQDGFIAPSTAVFSSSTGVGIPPSYSSDGAGTYQRVAHYDPVLLDAVNGVKRLGGLSTIGDGAPMDDVVASLEPLGNNTAIDTSQAPMAAATGDLQEQNRQQIEVDDLRAGPFGTGAPNTTPAAAAEPTEQAAPPAAAPPAEPTAQQGDNGAAPNSAQGNVTAIPLTLNEQLQAASQQRVAEREALAKLLAS